MALLRRSRASQMCRGGPTVLRAQRVSRSRLGSPWAPQALSCTSLTASTRSCACLLQALSPRLRGAGLLPIWMALAALQASGTLRESRSLQMACCSLQVRAVVAPRPRLPTLLQSIFDSSPPRFALTHPHSPRLDTGSHRIRGVVTSTGAVWTLAGSGAAAYADGLGVAASFNAPRGVSCDPATGGLTTIFVAGA